MSKREWWRAVGAAAVTAVLVVGGAVAAHAAPTPDSGPGAGGTTVTITEPAEVTFTSISAGGLHSVAIGSDGNTYAWGYNFYGALGDGTTTDSNFPVPVQEPAGVTFTSISAGRLHSIAIGSDGNTYAWGYNAFGQLGDGTTTSSSIPVQVQAPAGVTFTSITAAHHSVAIGSDGNTYAWGYNGDGQLGDGTNTNSSIPVLVQAPAGVTFTSVSAGGYHSVATGSDGNMYAWGFNDSGQLGNGTTVSSTVPVPVQEPAGVTFTSVAAGDYHSVAIGSDGNAYAWGYNDYGQLGDDTTTSSTVPVQVQAPAGVTFTSITAGDIHSVATGSDGNTYAWGYNFYGALGDGTNTDSSVPVQVQAPSVVVTSVSFDGIDGTNLVDNGDGTWSVDTPAHTAGSVDVVVSWTLGGTAQTPITHPNGFTYTPTPVAPTITNPGDQSVTAGDTATFTVTTTGMPTPTVTWEVSRDDGLMWEPISTDPAATPSSDGLTLSVVTDITHDGYQYRATADNGVGAPATSQGASLTVAPAPAAPTITNPGNQSVTAGDTATFTVTTTGTPTPTVTWEVSRNRGLTWRPIGTDPAATPSSDGLTLTVVTRLTHNGYQYRATADNGVGTPATSQPATLTVTLIPATQCQPNPWAPTNYTSIWKPLKPCNTHSLTAPRARH